MADQPREHDVLCSHCQAARTWNDDAICDACKVKVATQSA